MKLRTSFFNWTALRKDITRFAPVWALYLIGGLLIGLDTVSYPNSSLGHGAKDLASSIGPLTIVNLLYAIVTAELLFGDLFNNRLCNALHAFPMRRESWFATHTVAGILFSFVPNLILSICFLPCMGEMWYISFLWLLGMTMEYLFFFGLAAFSAMCTGNRFAMAAVYAIINFLSMIVYWFVMTFYEPLLYGLHIRETGFLRFCPTVWVFNQTELVEFERQEIVNKMDYYSGYRTKFTYNGLSDDWWYLAILAVLGIALLGAALLLYRRRKLESAGDFVAFRWLKPIFSVVFTLSVGALFEIFGETFMGGEYVFLVVGIIVGYFVGQMLLQRTVRVFRKKAFAACAAIGGTLVLSIILTALDPFGVTRWTPNPDKVESIVLSDIYNYSPEYNRPGQTITNPELIEDLVEIHQQILDSEEDDGYYSGSLHLTYNMSDGRVIERRYSYNSLGKTAKKLEKFFSAPEFILGYTDWEEYLDNVESVGVEGEWFGSELSRELLHAMKADCDAGNMTQDRKYEGTVTWVTIDYTDGYSANIQVYSNCEHTLAWIKAHVTDWAY